MDIELCGMPGALFEPLRMRVERSVKPKRYAHSLRVAQTARDLCEKFGVDFPRAAIASIAHDMCKEFSLEKLLEFSEQDGAGISAIESAHPSLLHGRAAAVSLRREYGIADEDILEAVRFHTFGKPDMCAIAKIVYIADKIEPGRKRAVRILPASALSASADCDADAGILRLDAFTLDELLYYVVDENIKYLEQKDEKVSPFSYALREGLEGVV